MRVSRGGVGAQPYGSSSRIWPGGATRSSAGSRRLVTVHHLAGHDGFSGGCPWRRDIEDVYQLTTPSPGSTGGAGGRPGAVGRPSSPSLRRVAIGAGERSRSFSARDTETASRHPQLRVSTGRFNPNGERIATASSACSAVVSGGSAQGSFSRIGGLSEARHPTNVRPEASRDHSKGARSSASGREGGAR